MRNLPRCITQRGGSLQRSYRSHLVKDPKRWVRPRESYAFTRLSMLIGPVLVPDNGRRVGGAAGNRTRVQSAYYARVYPHSPSEPERV